MKNFLLVIKKCLIEASMRKTIVMSFLFLMISLSSLGQITRTQIMNTAKSYSDASYTWTATNANKWNGISKCGRKIYYASPAYGGCVITGTNYGMPYCWGGWTTTSQHNSAMANGKSAGDICSGYSGGCKNSPGGAGLSCASGNDCSGHITITWGLSSKHNCLMLDGISNQISASKVQPGDIYNRKDHVRLVSSYNSGNGKVTVVEASGRDWRTSYYTYTPMQLSGYTPRVYKVLACSAPSSVFASSITASSAVLNWTASNANSYNYYLKKSSATSYQTYNNNTNKPLRLSGLSPNTTYNFMVSSNCSSGTSEKSSVYTFKTAKSSGNSYTKETSPNFVENAVIPTDTDLSSMFSLFPNPTKQGSEISITGLPAKSILSIYTIESKLLTTVVCQPGNSKIRLPSFLTPSVYIVNIKSDNGWTYNHKLIITE